MTVTVYRWDDASAPVLDGQASSHALINLLDKCLVAGYGSKSAAGWTKPYTGTGKAVFKNGTGSTGFHLRVDSSGSGQYPRLRGYETMSDVDTGTGLFPTDAQNSGGAYGVTSSTTDSTARPWLLIADAKRFYLYVGYNDTTTTGLASTAYKPIIFFGDIASHKTSDAYHCLLIAHTAASASSGYLAGINHSSIANAVSGHWLARSFTQTGTSITVNKMTDARLVGTSVIGALTGTYIAYPDPINGSIDLAPVFVVENAVPATRGVMPGLWATLHNLPGQPGDTFSGSGALNGKTFILLDAAAGTTRGRIVLETSDTW